MPFGLLSKTLDVRNRPTLRAICLAAILLVLLSVVYRRAPISFLRAESGLYLWVSQSSEAMQDRFQQEFVTRSYRGHWTPLAFLMEFWTTKLIGPRGTLWHYRQLLLLTVLGIASLVFVANMARALGLRPEQQRSAAVATCALLLFQPLMFEFVVWPFMGLQLVWMIFALLACLSCVQLGNDPNRIRWIWVGAGAAYASLHVLGIGLAVTIATAGVFLFLSILSFQCDWIFKPTRRHLLVAGALLILLSGGHCIAMALLLSQKTTASVRSLTLDDAKLGFEFLLRFVFAGLRSFTFTLHPI